MGCDRDSFPFSGGRRGEGDFFERGEMGDGGGGV